jgi:NodT family efflux transporter outer membrane factor (OMF) lipoprotein
MSKLPRLLPCALAISIALAGCVGPRPAPPQAASVLPPATWRSQVGDGDDRLSDRWWTSFADPVLSRLVERALAGNTDLSIAASRVEVARAQLGLARAAQTPQFDISASGGPQRAVNAFGRGTTQRVEQAQVFASYDLDLLQRVSHATEASRASVLASEAGRDAVRLAIVAATMNGYFNLRTLDARLSVLKEAARTRREVVRLATRRASVGYSPKLDERQAQAEVEATEALIPATRLAIARQEYALSLLLGDVPSPIERGRDLMVLGAPSLAVSAPSSLLRSRPDIAEAEQALAAADSGLDASRAAFLPTVRLSAQGGWVALSSTGDTVGVFAIGGSILAPILNRRRLIADADSAAARRDMAAFAYQRVVLSAFREVEDALATVALTQEQVGNLERQALSLEQVLTLAANRYREGYSPFLEQLDAQRALLAAQLNLVQARGETLAAQVHLFQALGGGWDKSPSTVGPLR